MSDVVALYGGVRVVTVCCGDHRPTGDCLCCHECPVVVATAQLDPAIRAVLAHDQRERAAALRMAFRRAEHAVGLAGYWDLFRATAHAVRVVGVDLPHFEGSLT